MTAAALTGDYPMPNRADLMSLQTINAKKDNTATQANKFSTVRNTSNNLHTGDIEGKFSQSSRSYEHFWLVF